MSGYVELYFLVLRGSDKAIFCDFGDTKCWIPLS